MAHGALHPSPHVPVQRGLLRHHVGQREDLLLGLLVRHVAAGRHVAAVVAGAAIVLQLRLVGWRQAVLGVELSLARRAAGGVEAGGGGVLGRPDWAAGDAGGEHRIGVVAQQGGALGQPGIDQDGRLAAGEELRADGRLGEGQGRSCEQRDDEDEWTDAAGCIRLSEQL